VSSSGVTGCLPKTGTAAAFGVDLKEAGFMRMFSEPQFVVSSDAFKKCCAVFCSCPMKPLQGDFTTRINLHYDSLTRFSWLHHQQTDVAHFSVST
jgi:hypothetical protein